MRVPWQDEFPPAFVHSEWQAELKGHPRHQRAKKHGDVPAASAIVEDLIQPDLLDRIYEVCFDVDERPPLVVTPAPGLRVRKNALSVTFGVTIAYESEWLTSSLIFQNRDASRDMVRDNWYRLTHEPTFYGQVEQGRRYVIADDVLTLGGTMASLRGFIHSQGAVVTAVTALAGSQKGLVPIAITESTKAKLADSVGGEVNELIRTELGYGIDCLTEAEGRFLLRSPSVDGLRDGLARGRSKSNPS